MKLLITTYSTAFTVSGGGESEMVQIAETIKIGNHTADIYGIDSRPAEYYDAIMHFSVHHDGWPLIQMLANQEKKILLWPNIWWQEKPIQEEVNRIQLFQSIAHKLLFRSYAERDNFIKYISVPLDKTVVLPICISNQFANLADQTLFRTYIHFSEYVLCIGRIEPVKNQLNLIKALKKIGLKGVMVGGSNNAEYLNRCKSEANGMAIFLPYIKPCSKALISIINGSSVVAEPCYDPAGRSALEGALLGKPLVLPDDEWSSEYLNSHYYSTEVSSVDSIASNILKAWDDQSGLAKNAKNLILQKNLSGDSRERFMHLILDALN